MVRSTPFIYISFIIVLSYCLVSRQEFLKVWYPFIIQLKMRIRILKQLNFQPFEGFLMISKIFLDVCFFP